MYIKIYFNNKPLFLCDAVTAEIEAYTHHDDAIFIDEFSNAGVNALIHEMRLEKVHAGVMLHQNLAQLKKTFWKKFTVIFAGGGLVRNNNTETLFIYRRGKWDLPKGKLDDGETLEECAIREVQEETGLQAVSVTGFLLPTYHTYTENGKHILKESHWYTMQAAGKETLIPQEEEQITDLKWVPAQDVTALLPFSYPSVADVWAKALQLEK